MCEIATSIRVEIVYAGQLRTIAKTFAMARGSLVSDALTAAALDPDFLADFRAASVGIFGRLVSKDQPLNEGDRIEIYRPLILEPKLARKRRVSKSGRS